jgi:hypothetical protein
MTLPEIDLTQHILFTAFRNKYIAPKEPTTTQQLISKLMTEYSHVFPNSGKISYTIATLKNNGLIYEEQWLDEEAFNKCVEEMWQKHPKMGEQRVRSECLKKIGYRSVLLPTEGGVIEFCMKVKPYLTGRTTATNKRILDVCENYKAEGEKP